MQQKNVEDKVHEKFPLVLTSGRLVEYEGGGEETRSNPWLAELMQDNFVEINPKAAADRGIRQRTSTSGSRSPTGARIKVKALVTERVGQRPRCSSRSISRAGGRAWTCCRSIPRARRRSCAAEAVNTATTYGYDRVTMMQETKTTLCQVERA